MLLLRGGQSSGCLLELRLNINSGVLEGVQCLLKVPDLSPSGSPLQRSRMQSKAVLEVENFNTEMAGSKARQLIVERFKVSLQGLNLTISLLQATS